MCLVKPYDPYFSSYGQFTVKSGPKLERPLFLILQNIYDEDGGIVGFMIVITIMNSQSLT